MIEKLHPAYKDNLWGGRKLPDKYGKATDKDPVAESWELSMHPAGETMLSDGRRLSEAVGEAELGKNVAKFSSFPVLVKLIDAKENLSVQVHPDDEYALEHENSYGKTELWYVVEADEGAGIYLGFCEKTSEGDVRRAIEEERLTDLLKFYPVKAGDSYFIPAGTVHAIGAGVLICEVQESSDITYRVYDYGRRDKSGNTRELHVEDAMRVAKFEKYEKPHFPSGVLGECGHFTAREVRIDGEYTLAASVESFRCVTCVSGSGSINGKEIKAAESYFISADEGDATLKGSMTVILTEVPSKC